MAASSLKQYMDRSLGILRRNTAKVMKMDIGNNPLPLPILSFASSSSSSPSASSSALSHPGSFALGSDLDIGGLSSSALTPVASSSAQRSHMAFHGNLSLAVPPQYQGKIRTGYAAFRTKTRPTLFGEETWDMSLYTHLKVVVGYRGWEGWRDRWVVNLQTDGPVRSDLYQYRLPLPSSTTDSSPLPLDPAAPPPPNFSTFHLPLASFVLTNSGQTASQQIPMMRTKIRTLGFALLGGGRTTEDATAPAPMSEAASQHIRKMGAGGWRGGDNAGEVEVDHELEELMRSDLPQGRAGASEVVRPASTGSGGGYHRVGAAAPVDAAQPLARPESEGSPAGVEGYYELCIKSVEAVKWDPESDDSDDVDVD